MRLRSQWISLVILFLILASIAYVGYRASATDLETRIHDQLRSIWRLKAQQITAWHLDGRHDAASIAEDADLRDHLRASLAGSPDARTRLVRTLRSIRREQGYLDIVVLDSARGYVASAREAQPSREALARWTAFLPADSTVVTPLYAQVESESGESFLLRREQDHAVYLSNLRFRSGPALSHREPLSHRDVIGVRAVRGESGMIRGTGYHGDAARAFVGPVPDTPWVLAAQVSENEILAPLRTRMYISLGFVLLLMAVTGAGLHIRQNRKQLADVLARQTAERVFTQALEESEEKYRSLVEFSSDAVLINQHDRFVYCNPAMLPLLGTRTETDILGKSPFDIFHPDDHDAIRARIQTLRESGIPREQQHFRLLRVDGSVLDIEASATLFRYRGETAIQVVLRDITERLVARRKIEEALTQAEQANTLKTLFLTNISHELRTPLNNILGYNALIRETCPLARDGEYAEYFDAVSEGGARLLRTVHSILEIARIQSGTYERLQQDFDIAEMMAGMIDDTRTEARRRGLAFVFLSDQPSVTVRGDVESLRVAIAHLIDNAVKFTEHGGVDIRLRREEAGVILSISDTGIGISSDYLARLREPFSQESEGFTKKYQGIGLGMSIAIHHLEANAVRWELRSDMGVGTHIVLRFS